MYSYLDHYCERAEGLGLFAEPLNLLTNAAFIIAAYFAFKLLRTSGRTSWHIALLIIALASIGIGSGLWHLIPQQWTMLADVIPIMLFINIYILSFLIQIAECRPLTAALWWLAYQGVVYATGYFFSPDTLGGTIMYMPTYLALIMMALYLQFQQNNLARLVWQALALWTLSLTLRTLDMQLCSVLPFGTHFLWHIFNAIVLYWLVKGLILHKQDT